MSYQLIFKTTSVIHTQEQNQVNAMLRIKKQKVVLNQSESLVSYATQI